MFSLCLSTGGGGGDPSSSEFCHQMSTDLPGGGVPTVFFPGVTSSATSGWGGGVPHFFIKRIDRSISGKTSQD